eukprot:1155616-Pelagomonas_calceolata.AAC.11
MVCSGSKGEDLPCDACIALLFQPRIPACSFAVKFWSRGVMWMGEGDDEQLSRKASFAAPRFDWWPCSLLYPLDRSFLQPGLRLCHDPYAHGYQSFCVSILLAWARVAPACLPEAHSRPTGHDCHTPLIEYHDPLGTQACTEMHACVLIAAAGVLDAWSIGSLSAAGVLDVMSIDSLAAIGVLAGNETSRPSNTACECS